MKKYFCHKNNSSDKGIFFITTYNCVLFRIENLPDHTTIIQFKTSISSLDMEDHFEITSKEHLYKYFKKNTIVCNFLKSLTP